jgi:hypothetical protein
MMTNGFEEEEREVKILKKKKREKKLKMEREVIEMGSDLNYLSNEEFAARFHRSLLSYLNRTLPSKESNNHIEDLMAHTAAFADAITTFTYEF